MGWTYGWFSKKEIIADRIETREYDGRRRDCIKHCYRGNAHSGVLWTVWVITEVDTMEVLDSYIGCDKLKCYRVPRGSHEWGYKDMCESMGPYYYSCPLSYLEMVPVASEEWRQKVREYHAKRSRKIQVGAVYKAVPGITFKKNEIRRIRVDSLRPNRGTIYMDGWTKSNVKFSKSHLGAVLAAPIEEAVA